MTIPPGPIYVVQRLPAFVLSSALAYAALDVLQRTQKINLPTWLVVLLVAIARPVGFYVQQAYQNLSDAKTAGAHGAVLPSEVAGTSISIMKQIIDNVKSGTGYPLGLLEDWRLKYGNTYKINLLTSSMVYTVEPVHLKAILATQFDDFHKGPTFRHQLESLLGNGVFNSDGDMWKFHRTMTRPFFTRERISDFEIYERNSSLSLDLAKQRLTEGQPFDFQDLAGRFTLDSSSEFLFGGSVASLLAGIPYPPASADKNRESYYKHPSNSFVKAFGQAQVATLLRTELAQDWPLAEFSRDEVKPLRKVIDDFTTPLMERALLQKEKRAGDSEEAREDEPLTLLDHLVNHTQDRELIKDELVNLLVAGRDTTMCLLTYSMYMLTQHPEVEARLRQEMLEKVGPNETPTYENMRDMKYMRAFLNEVLRLYPPVPGNNRSTKHAVVLPTTGPNEKPIYLPANTLCLFGTLMMQRREDLWGPDAMKFDPDRFIDERLQRYLTPNPFIFCPFNAGPRICLGQQFAYHEATFFLITLLQRFTSFALDKVANIQPPAEWAEKADRRALEKIHPKTHLTMYIKGGLWITMKELKGSDF